MPNLTPQQERKLKKVIKVVEEGNLAIAEHLFEMEEMFDSKVKEIQDSVPNIDDVLKSVKGADGKDGVDGNDGEPGPIGPIGPEGKQGPKGDSVQGPPGPQGPIGMPGPAGKDGVSIVGPAGKDGKDGSPDTPEQIASKLNTLKGAVDSDVIKGLNDLKRNLAENLARFNPTMGPSFADLKRLETLISTSSGTPGGSNTQIQFNDSGVFGGDSAFIWDKTNDRLGINTSSPASRISVNGNASIGGSYATIAAPTNGMIIQGDVGIGTSSPSYSLHIVDTDTAFQAATMRLYGSGTGDGWRGRLVAGGPNVAFLMGEISDSGSGAMGLAWLGAHNAALNAWEDFYINPDGPNKLYLGGNGGFSGGPIITIDNNAAGSYAAIELKGQITGSSPGIPGTVAAWWEVIFDSNTYYIPLYQ